MTDRMKAAAAILCILTGCAAAACGCSCAVRLVGDASEESGGEAADDEAADVPGEGAPDGEEDGGELGEEDAADLPAEPDGEEDAGEETGECAWAKIGGDVRVTAENGSSLFPSLAWAGSEYGVAWYDERSGNDIYFTSIGASGEPRGTDTLVTDETFISESPALAWSGSEYALAWQDFLDGSSEICMARLRPAGGRIGGYVRVTNGPSASTYASIAWTGSEYALAWVDTVLAAGNEEIYLARVSAAGEKIGGDVRLTDDPMSSFAPAVAWGGSEIGVAWHDWRTGSGDVFFARVSPAGEKEGEETRVTEDPWDSFVVSLAWTGSEYGAAWHDSRGPAWAVYFARISPAGGKIGEEAKISSSSLDTTFASLVWTGSEYAIAWQETASDSSRIQLARVSADGERKGEPITLSNGPSESQQPSLAWSGSELGVAWQDDRDGNYEIYFARAGCL